MWLTKQRAVDLSLLLPLGSFICARRATSQLSPLCLSLRMTILGTALGLVFYLIQGVSGESGYAQNGESFLTFLKDFGLSFLHVLDYSFL